MKPLPSGQNGRSPLDLRLDSRLARLGLGCEGVGELRHRRAEIDLLHIPLRRGHACQTGEVQDVLHQVGEAPRFPIDDAGRALPLFVGLQLVVVQQLSEDTDLGEWRPELVGYPGDEVVAQTRELMLAADLDERRSTHAQGEEHEPQEEGNLRAGQSPDDEE